MKIDIKNFNYENEEFYDVSEDDLLDINYEDLDIGCDDEEALTSVREYNSERKNKINL